MLGQTGIFIQVEMPYAVTFSIGDHNSVQSVWTICLATNIWYYTERLQTSNKSVVAFRMNPIQCLPSHHNHDARKYERLDLADLRVAEVGQLT